MSVLDEPEELGSAEGEQLSTSGTDSRPDPRNRPPDPAGTQPKHDPSALLPSTREPLLAAPEILDPEVDDAREPSLLPVQRARSGPPAVGAVRHTRWSHRFHFLLGGLVAIGLAAITAAVVVVLEAGDEPTAGPRWSAWAPTTSGPAGAAQIASHVSPAYRLPDGRQLVAVSAAPLEINGVPLSIALRESPEQGGEIKQFDDDGVIYRLCGLGQNCAIAAGKATPERHLLLRREALELALYSFRYLDDVHSVVVLLPPPAGEQPPQALFFREGDVASQLARPLTATLAANAPSVESVTLSPDARLVDEVTMPKTFTFSLTQANADNRGFIVLDPIVAGSTAAPADAEESNESTDGG